MNYEIKYSKRRTVSLKITEGGLVVLAPTGLSRERIDQIVNKHEKWIEKHTEKVKRESDFWGSMTDEDIRALREDAREILTKKTRLYSNIMGLSYGRITITGAKTRFGSCSSAGALSYSYRLMAYPDRAIDYVVVHELCHLVHMNHSREFYALLERYLPDYKERRALLKSK
jgi:predicted metal-dependent hydrolase